MNARLASHMLVGALVKRAGQAGGFAMILHRGDATSGVILVQCLEKGQKTGLFERVSTLAGGYALAACGPQDAAESEQADAYVARRLRADPDLWLIELDVADAERFAAETIC
ncbi:DUF1491 family protein [soil metagenome]